MAKNSAVNLDITNNADGYDISGGTTKRKLTVTGADVTLTGSGSNTYTFPSATDTLVGRDSTDTLTNKTIAGTSNTITISETDITDLGSYLTELVSDTTPQLGGNLDYNSNGIVLTGQTVGGSDGNLVYLSSANTWSQADADAAATCSSLLGIRISSTIVLTQGVYTTTGLSAGSTYYASTTAGGITTTAPSGTGNIVRIIGYALSTTELYIAPETTYIEV